MSTQASERDPCARVADRFAVAGRFVRSERFGSGHIHETYLAHYAGHRSASRSVIQRLNQGVFPDPERLMANVQAVTEALAADSPSHALRLIPTRDERAFLRDEEDECWRCFELIADGESYDSVGDARRAYQAALAFGRFADCVCAQSLALHEIIPRFHHTPNRLADLREAVHGDPLERRARSRPVLEMVEGLAPLAPVLVDAITRGLVKERIAHNDAKINNVLFDASGEALCVVDLDTVMPGTPLFDFGDLVRTASCEAPEDCTELDRVEMSETLYEAIHAGFLDAVGARLRSSERELLPAAGVVITLETGVRFLTDYLNGDHYFRIARPEHNLDRARCQLHLALDIAAKLGVRW